MAYNDNSCVANLGNTGLSNCLDDLGYDAMLLWTPETFEIDTEADAKLQATYTDAIDAGNMFPMPIADEVENTVEDDVLQELPTGVSLFVREGKYGGIMRFRTALCNLPNLRTFNEVSGRAFIVTSNGKILGTSPDGTKFKGFLLSRFHVSVLKGTDGSTVRFIELTYQFKNTTEMGDYPAIPDLAGAWDPLSLTGVKDVVLTLSSSSATEVVVTIAGKCDGQVITGLVVGDFVLVDDGGGSETINSVTESPDGTYTLDVTTLTADDYILNLKSPSAQTTGGYESTGSVTFTVT